jgi:hypothetical protein
MPEMWCSVSPGSLVRSIRDDVRPRTRARPDCGARGRGLDLIPFWREATEVLRRAVPFYETPCWYTLDPASLLVTSHFHDGLDELPPEWLAHEYYVDDVNKLADVARSQRGVSTLHEATGGEPASSPRWHFNMTMGGDQELIAALRTPTGDVWGRLACTASRARRCSIARSSTSFSRSRRPWRRARAARCWSARRPIRRGRSHRVSSSSPTAGTSSRPHPGLIVGCPSFRTATGMPVGCPLPSMRSRGERCGRPTMPSPKWQSRESFRGPARGSCSMGQRSSPKALAGSP